jgi:hypothetical protein
MTAAATALTQLSDQYETLSVREVQPAVNRILGSLHSAEVNASVREWWLDASGSTAMGVRRSTRKGMILFAIEEIERRVLSYQRTKRI